MNLLVSHPKDIDVSGLISLGVIPAESMASFDAFNAISITLSFNLPYLVLLHRGHRPYLSFDEKCFLY